MKSIRRFLARLLAFTNRRGQEQRLQDEFEEHIALFTEDRVRAGLSPAEARREAALAFGSVEAAKDSWRDQRGLPRFEAIIADIVFGWRQLNKHRAASAAAILSLALAIGATTAAFRLVDAVLLRTLPVAEPERLFYLGTSFVDREGKPDYFDDFDYPSYRKYRDLVAGSADLMVAGMNHPEDVTFGSSNTTERAYRQYVSGNLFSVFGLQPALGRLFTPEDDRVPGGHPIAVLSYDYWTRRFARDPGAIGKTFRMGTDRFEIIGVAPKGFVGTEPGEVTDVFLPAMMNTEAISKADWSWLRIWLRPRPGFSAEQVRQPLQADFFQEQRERLKAFHSDTPRQVLEAHLNRKILVFPAAYGASRLQKQYREPLMILSVMVALVLLVACINLANLLAAQAAGRSREMALRISIGAGRWRLVQLVLVESLLLAIAASVLGAWFAAWAAPLVTSMLRVPGDPVRLILDTGWRELGFSAALALLVTLLFGLPAALRASAVQPAHALKGGSDPHSRRRLMNTLLAAQVAFCVLVLFVSGLFLNTFHRLATRPLGLNPEHILILFSSSTDGPKPQSAWFQAIDRLRQFPGVESASLAAWPLLSGDIWSGSVRLPGHAVETRQPYFLDVAPGFFATMRISRIDGRDFRPGDLPPRLKDAKQPLPGVGIVNEAFARMYFNGANPIGRSVDVLQRKDISAPMLIVGYVRDTVYRDVRQPIQPTVFIPTSDDKEHNTFLVRTAGDPETMALPLQREISRARPDIRVRNTRTQMQFIHWHLVRDRLLAALSGFFAIVALVLAAVGLYGVLNYSVASQRREISIRMALGARPTHVVRRVTADLAMMLCIGATAGLAGGLASSRLFESLLFGLKSTDVDMSATPILTLAIVATVAALPPAVRAARIDPAQTLRGD